MKQNSNILVPLLVGPALLAFSSVGADIGFHPAAGTSLTKTLTQKSEVSLEDMSISQNGVEIDPSMMGSVDMTVTTNQTVAVTDEYVDVDGSKVKKLQRTFDTLSNETNTAMSNQMMGDMNQDIHSASELEGKTVVFTWDADSKSYQASYPDGTDGDPALLKDLKEDLDLDGFLPTGEVEDGASWDVPAEVMKTVLAPGGALKLKPTDLDEQMGMMGGNFQPSPDQFLTDMEGSVTAEYSGTDDVEGVQLARIKLTFDVSSNSDLTDLMSEMLKDAQLPNDMKMDFKSFDMEFSYQGEGELLWNVQAGVVQSLEVSGELGLTIDQSMNISGQGMDIAMEQSLSLSGTQSLDLKTSE